MTHSNTLPSEDAGIFWFTYGDHEIQLSWEDRDLHDQYRWRVLIVDDHYQVVATAPWSEDDPRRKRNVSLSRLVAERMGLPEDKRVRFVNGDQLDCRRENVAASNKGRRGQAPRTVSLLQNPPGIHRHRVGDERPALAYQLCTGARTSIANICLQRSIVAVATRTTPTSQLWVVRFGNGERSEPLIWNQLHTVVRVVDDYDCGTFTENQSAA